MEFRYSFVFWSICWENTFSFFRQKSINMAAVTEQTTEAFDWKLIGLIERGRIHWNFPHSKSMVWNYWSIPNIIRRSRWSLRGMFIHAAVKVKPFYYRGPCSFACSISLAIPITILSASYLVLIAISIEFVPEISIITCTNASNHASCLLELVQVMIWY